MLNNQTVTEAIRPEIQKLEKGLMLYTARDLFEKDVEEGMNYIASQGFVNVELITLKDHPMVPDPFFGHSSERFHELMLAAGLKPVSAHCNPMGDIEPQLEAANALGIKHLVFPIAPAFMMMTETGPTLKDLLEPEDCFGLAEMLNQMGELCKSSGVQLAYHNHHAEFIENKGHLPYDLILEHTDPELVFMELDVGWVAKVGLNPAEVLFKNPGRFTLLHLKDLDPNLPSTGIGEEFVAPGEGVLDFNQICEAAVHAGVSYGLVECDHPVDTRSMIEKAARHFQL